MSNSTPAWDRIWFSLRVAAFSEALGVTVGAGDVLSDHGYIVRSASERASDPADSYAPASPIVPVLRWRDQVESVGGRDFYRVRQW